ncbi:hypothetical protein AURDEDRAFT_176671 [Auricularia subglabra TFB-10046 SS5]|uniref:F-box domain-containing protein n=1 Tax=Auricularia subglabra (strain TFB-10046 / SS5) TaxID=717982 RepID=J0D603_AURST|nr:hypothetical protein AURDEDRAFT_176671 [Auricularia subglabra TFB-10046 SS5]
MAVTRSRAVAFRIQKLALPEELTLAILKCLPLDELWTAAHVSRRFYALALDAGLRIHRDIAWTIDSGHVSELNEFKDVLEHVKQKGMPPLSLDLWTYFPGEDSIHRASIYENASSGADDILPVITAALPFLVHLSIKLPDHFRAHLDAALCHPAPLLRTLHFECSMPDEPSPPLPCNLFAGLAPQLRRVSCTDIILSDLSVTAFQAVDHAYFSYKNRFPAVHIRLLFPRVTSLHLRLSMVGNAASLPECFDLRGLALHSLTIQGRDYSLLQESVQRSIDLSTIPAVRAISGTITWSESLWTKDPAMISMRISVDPEHRGDLSVMVIPEHRRWRRLYRVVLGFVNGAIPVTGLPSLSTRLTYLRLDAALLRAFLTLAIPYSELRNLHIDVQSTGLGDYLALKPPDYDLYRDVQSFESEIPHDAGGIRSPCSALEEITLFALDAPISDADSRRVAFLLRALGQFERAKNERAALALVGIRFAEPAARALLSQTVSRILTYAFAGRGSREDHDKGLWDHAF